MNIPFTIEELISFQDKGTLESHLLSNGLLPMKVLEYVLEDTTLLERISELEYQLDKLEEEYEN